MIGNRKLMYALTSFALASALQSCSKQDDVMIPEAYEGTTPVDSGNGDQKPTTPQSSNQEVLDPVAPSSPSSQPNESETPPAEPVVTVPPQEPTMPSTTPTTPTTTPTTPSNPTTPTETPAPTPVPVVKKYVIVGDASGRCVSLPSYTSGVQLVLRDCTNADNQVFTLESVGTNAAKIVASNGYVIQIRTAAPADSVVVQAGPYTGASHQQWQIEARNYQAYGALNLRGTVFTMDAKDFGTASGTPIQIYRTDTPTANQRWIIRPIN